MCVGVMAFGENVKFLIATTYRYPIALCAAKFGVKIIDSHLRYGCECLGLQGHSYVEVR